MDGTIALEETYKQVLNIGPNLKIELSSLNLYSFMTSRGRLLWLKEDFQLYRRETAPGLFGLS